MALGTLLSACAHTNSVLSIKGACDSFQAPAFAIKGKTRPDQAWVDGTTESGIAACGWMRPKNRPVVKSKIQTPKSKPFDPVFDPTPEKPPEVVPVTPKLSLWQKFKAYWFGAK